MFSKLKARLGSLSPTRMRAIQLVSPAAYHILTELRPILDKFEEHRRLTNRLITTSCIQREKVTGILQILLEDLPKDTRYEISERYLTRIGYRTESCMGNRPHRCMHCGASMHKHSG